MSPFETLIVYLTFGYCVGDFLKRACRWVRTGEWE